MATPRRGDVSPQDSPIEKTSRWSISTCSTLEEAEEEDIAQAGQDTAMPYIWVQPPSPSIKPQASWRLEHTRSTVPSSSAAQDCRESSARLPSPQLKSAFVVDALQQTRPGDTSKPLPELVDRYAQKVAAPPQRHQSKTWRSQKRHTSILRKIGSLASSRLSLAPGFRDLNKPLPQPVGASEETDAWDTSDPITVDITTLEGPSRAHNRHSLPFSFESSVQDEAKGVLTGGIGSGLDHVIDALLIPLCEGESPTRSQAVRRTWRSSYAALCPKPLHIRQQAAEKLGAIVAVDEDVGIDISNLDGGDTTHGPEDHLPATDKSRSYYFPSDPQMPDWKPFPMRSWFILLLIFLAIVFAAIQEFLCLWSIKMENGPQGGLLSFVNIQDVTNLDFFTWRYFPTIVFVTYGAMWQATNYEVQRLEPFYQLSRPGGALASRSLNVEYTTFWSFWVPIKAFHYRHWAVMVSSFSTLLASGLVPILQSAALNLLPDRGERREGEPKYVRIDPVWSRLTEAGLLVAALGGIVLLFQLKRKSGLLSDPKGIAGIAAMANRSHILNDFRGLDMVENGVIHEQLKQRRYILHKSSLWQGEYISSSQRANQDPNPNRRNPHPIMLQLKAGIPYIVFLVACMALLPVIVFTDVNSVTETLPWLLTAVATITKLIWNTLDLNVRGLEPFYILSRRNAPPSTLTMDYTGTVPGWMPLQASLNRNFLVAAVGFGAILNEVLIVCVSSFNVDGKVFIINTQPSGDAAQGLRFNTSETLNSFWVSLSLALVILLYLSITAVVVYIKRRHAFLPRQPSTIASILAFIHQSRMLYDFVTPEEWTEKYPRIEELDSRTMTKYLESMGETYGLGWYQGRDGRDHLGIDKEPLLSDYTHGRDWREGRVREVGGWDAY